MEADRCTESVEDEDEVLTALGDELGNFVEYVGGPEYGHVLLSPLENLATIEEPLVRDKVSTYHRALGKIHSVLIQRSSGCRVSQQDLRSALTTAGRDVLHPTHYPLVQGRLVHFQNLCHGTVQHSLPTCYTTIAGSTASAI